MANRDLAAGVFRAWGLIWLIRVLLAIPEFVNAALRHAFRQSEAGVEGYVVSSQVIWIGCGLILGILLLRKANWLSEIVFPEQRDIALPIQSDDFRRILFAAVALYFILDGTSHALGSAYQLVTRPAGDGSNSFSYLWQRAPEDLVRALGGLIAGILVLFAGRHDGILPGIRATYREYLGPTEPPDSA